VRLSIFQSSQLAIVTESRQNYFFKVEKNEVPGKPSESPVNLAHFFRKIFQLKPAKNVVHIRRSP
jgi:hypothetical protein